MLLGIPAQYPRYQPEHANTHAPRVFTEHGRWIFVGGLNKTGKVFFLRRRCDVTLCQYSKQWDTRVPGHFVPPLQNLGRRYSGVPVGYPGSGPATVIPGT
eukprot:830122-Rhodomonas_salina.1